MKKTQISALTAGSLAIVIALAGCTDASGRPMPGMNHRGDDPPSRSAQDRRGAASMADRMFTMMMIPHHEQAIEMSDLLLVKSGVDERVRDLAGQIKAAQAPEITLMESWLEDWGMPSSGGMSGMGHDDGMLSDDEIAALEAADGPEGTRLFLEQMIVHHEGAIEMAEDVLDDGSDPDVRALAQRIIESQSAEIVTMKDLLTQV